MSNPLVSRSLMMVVIIGVRAYIGHYNSRRLHTILAIAPGVRIDVASP